MLHIWFKREGRGGEGMSGRKNAGQYRPAIHKTSCLQLLQVGRPVQGRGGGGNVREKEGSPLQASHPLDQSQVSSNQSVTNIFE